MDEKISARKVRESEKVIGTFADEPPRGSLIIPMRAYASRTEAQFVGAELWLCGSRAGSNNGERAETGREPPMFFSSKQLQRCGSSGRVNRDADYQYLFVLSTCGSNRELRSLGYRPPETTGVRYASRFGATWPASAVVAEGMEAGSVVSYWASSYERSTGGARVWVEREWRTPLRNRHDQRQPKKRYEVVSEC